MEIIARKKGRRGIPEATKKRVVELYLADQLTVPEIAGACGISARSVFRIIAERRSDCGEEKD